MHIKWFFKEYKQHQYERHLNGNHKEYQKDLILFHIPFLLTFDTYRNKYAMISFLYRGYIHFQQFLNEFEI